MQVPAGWLNVFQTGKQYIVVVKYVGFRCLCSTAASITKACVTLNESEEEIKTQGWMSFPRIHRPPLTASHEANINFRSLIYFTLLVCDLCYTISIVTEWVWTRKKKDRSFSYLLPCPLPSHHLLFSSLLLSTFLTFFSGRKVLSHPHWTKKQYVSTIGHNFLYHCPS